MKEYSLKAHQVYLEALRRMTPQQKLDRIFEMTDNANKMLYDNLKNTFPGLSEKDLKKLYLKRLDLCHNRNW
jgi:hypothetical protein